MVMQDDILILKSDISKTFLLFPKFFIEQRGKKLEMVTVKLCILKMQIPMNFIRISHQFVYHVKVKFCNAWEIDTDFG